MLNSKIVNISLSNDSSKTVNEYIKLDKLQIELNLENDTRLVIQFDDILLSCAACELEREKEKIKASKEYQLYLKKFNRLKESYLSKKLQNQLQESALISQTTSRTSKKNKKALKSSSGGKLEASTKKPSLNFIEAKRDDLISTIASLIGCIGCRVSVERFYTQLIKNSDIISKLNETIYPILIDSNENLTLNFKLFLVDPFKLYSIFYLNSIFKAEGSKTNTNSSSTTTMTTTSSTFISSSIYGSYNANVIITTTTT